MFRIATFLAALLAALPARAAEVCVQVAGGAPLVPVPQARFPADVKPFVTAADPSFQDQVIELYPLGKGGAGLAVHYEGTLASEYLVAFDRIEGKLKAVPVPDLNPEADDYFEAHVALVKGTAVLFSTREVAGKKITRLAPWLGHGFGPVCETGN